MRRDHIFFKIFQQNPSLLFEFVDNKPPEANNYRFESVTVKETRFEIDGVFLPPDNATTKIAYFAEFQFQQDERLYFRVFTELMMYMDANNRSETPYDDWGCILIYGSRSLEPSKSRIHRAMLASEQTRIIYLNELGDLREQSLGLGLMMLTIVPERNAIESAKFLMDKAQTESNDRLSEQAIIDLITTIIVNKFSTLERKEIEAMLGITLEESRVYQDAKVDEAIIFVTRLLNRKIGKLPEEIKPKIEELSLEQLEDLGEALLNFSSIINLEQWLKARPKPVEQE
jgi:predicted transposase/invertase (TIGR01784 family)